MKKVSIIGKSILQHPEYLQKAVDMIIKDAEVSFLMEEGLGKQAEENFMRMPGRRIIRCSDLEHIRADVCEWWRAGGMPIADTQLVKDARQISSMTYKELRDLAYVDEDVLPEEAVFFLNRMRIPLFIKNICSPSDSPVYVKSYIEDEPEYTVTGIRGQKDYVSVNISRQMRGMNKGFGMRILEIFDKHGISYVHVAAGIDTQCVFVRREDFEVKEQEVLAELYRLEETESIRVENNLALLAVIGRKLTSVHGAVGKLFCALDQEEIPIKMIDHGFSHQSVMIGVPVEDFERAVRAIYHLFVEVHI